MKTSVDLRFDVEIEKCEVTGCYSAWCPALDVRSAGNTEEEAFEAIRSAIRMTIRHRPPRQAAPPAPSWRMG